MEPIQFFYLNLAAAKNSAGWQTQKLKLGSYNLYIPCKVLNMHESFGYGALGPIAQKVIWCHDVWRFLVRKRLIWLVSRSSGCQTRE